MPATGATGSGVKRAPRADGGQDAPKGADPQDSSIAAAGSDGVSALDTTTAVEAMASPTTIGAATGNSAASTGLVASAPPSPPRMAVATASMGADDNAVEEPEVIMGHPGLEALGSVSLSEAMIMAHFVLNQVHDVLRQESENINEDRLRLSVWVSLIKQWMTSEKEKAEARQKHLDVMEFLYSRRQAVVDKLDGQTQKLLHDTKELYAAAEAHANATIKQQKDLNAQAVTMAKWEQAVAEQELKLREREEQDDLRLEHELEDLASRESDLNNREATLAAERKDLEETRAVVLAREFVADIRDSGLNSNEEKLADWEKRLVKREQQLVGRQL
jgi:hypothetical protein